MPEPFYSIPILAQLSGPFATTRLACTVVAALAQSATACGLICVSRRKQDKSLSWIFRCAALLMTIAGVVPLLEELNRNEATSRPASLIEICFTLLAPLLAVVLWFWILQQRKQGSSENASRETPVRPLEGSPTSPVNSAKIASEQNELAQAEIRRLNESLHHRVLELQTLLDLLPVGIAIAQDVMCRDLRSNRIYAEMLGLPLPHTASLSAPPLSVPPFNFLQNGRVLNPNELPMRRVAAENQPLRDFEGTIIHPDGRQVHVVFNAVPLHDLEGRARGCVATIQDVTSQKNAAQERVALERRLQEMQKLESLGVLAGGVAHDFNNLLTGIMGNASLARLELPDGLLSVRTALDNLEQAALQAADLCKQMLAYAGKGRFVVQPSDLSLMVREMSELLAVSVAGRASLQFDLAEGLPSFQGDPAQIRQVLLNLTINAAEAIGEQGGVVLIRTTAVYADAEYIARMLHGPEVRPGKYLCMEVSDTGPGMDQMTHAKIFEPFFSTKFTGRGLGLPAVLGIVRGHHGAIQAESEVGRGTIIRILFPLAAEPTSSTVALSSPPLAAKKTGALLLVDDDEAVREVATYILKNAGFAVTAAEDGHRAMEIVAQSLTEFEVVLLDLTMPRMDGEEAFRSLRALRPNLPIIIMSGYSEQDTAQRFIGESISGIVPKPFTAEILLTKIREATERSSQGSIPALQRGQNDSLR